MKVLLANPRGFCAGVNMAIDCVDRVLELKGPPIYVFHEIVHNKHVVQDFESRGVVFVNEIEASIHTAALSALMDAASVSSKERCQVILSSHSTEVLTR